MSVVYLSRTAEWTAATISSRSRRSVVHPSERDEHWLKKRAASAKEFSSVAFADGSVFQ